MNKKYKLNTNLDLTNIIPKDYKNGYFTSLKETREKAQEDIKNGMSVDEIVSKYRKSYAWAYKLSRNIEPTILYNKRLKDFKVLKYLLKRKYSYRQIILYTHSSVEYIKTIEAIAERVGLL